MARSFTFPSKRFEGFGVSPNDIEVDYTENGRAFSYSPEDVKDLLEDFARGVGVQSPIVVQPWKTEEKPKGLKALRGYRRLYAAKLWAEDHPGFMVPVIIEEPPSPKAALIENIRENVARKDLSHIDLGSNAIRLQNEGMNNKEIAEVLGVSPAQVTQHMKLVVELPERLQIMVHKNQLTADDAFAVLKLPLDQREAFVMEHLERNQNGSASDSDNAHNSSESLEGSDGDSASQSQTSRQRRSSIRESIRESGVNVGAVRMPGFKKYLQQALDEEGPGSNKGEVELKRSILSYLEGDMTDRQLDNRFDKFCKQKGF